MAQSKSRRPNVRVRGAYIVEYLITIGALALVVATVLATVAGPYLAKEFRISQRSAAAPIP